MTGRALLLVSAAAVGSGLFLARPWAGRSPPPAPFPEWPGPSGAPPLYPWLEAPWDPTTALHRQFPQPPGFLRSEVAPGSFAEWLRCLPLEPGRGVVRYHGGRPKPDQTSHAAVVAIDVGTKDLQQCADSAIRLRAEYLYSRADASGIAFHFTSGDLARWDDWRRGLRPVVRGNSVSWSRSAAPDDSHASFRAWLDVVFTYAGTISLARETAAAGSFAELEAGDVLLRAGSPGHAVVVVDLATSPETGERVAILAQGYMPAQSLHVLARPASDGADPWFPVPASGSLDTGSWEFGAGDVRRFR